jgi:hypothetical protein
MLPILQVDLENLFGNAWKYTGKRTRAVIEFGSTEIDGKQVYFIRDNGIGFDNGTADKLFVPFKRLPGAEAFRGFGIGLATVERIIRRHGGSIWAEGEPDKGATFISPLQHRTLPCSLIEDLLCSEEQVVSDSLTVHRGGKVRQICYINTDQRSRGQLLSRYINIFGDVRRGQPLSLHTSYILDTPIKICSVRLIMRQRTPSGKISS